MGLGVGSGKVASGGVLGNVQHLAFRVEKVLICSNGQFQWCKYSCHGRLHAMNVTSLNTKLGRSAQYYTQLLPNQYSRYK